MVITSDTNAKVAELKKLSDKKYRRKSGKYILEGARLINDAARFGADIVAVFVRESNSGQFDYPQQTVLSDRVFDKISDTVNSQGVLAICRKTQCAPCAPTGNCLVLDCVSDPGNVGTLLRTAAACGFTDVYAVGSADLYSPKVLRSAMSAHFRLALHEMENMAQALDLLGGTPVFAADMHGTDVFCVEFPPKAALVVGNEGNGLSEYTRLHVNDAVALPMEGNFESLNAAVAGSVIMYQMYRSNHK